MTTMVKNPADLVSVRIERVRAHLPLLRVTAPGVLPAPVQVENSHELAVALHFSGAQLSYPMPADRVRELIAAGIARVGANHVHKASRADLAANLALLDGLPAPDRFWSDSRSQLCTDLTWRIETHVR